MIYWQQSETSNSGTKIYIPMMAATVSAVGVRGRRDGQTALKLRALIYDLRGNGGGGTIVRYLPIISANVNRS